MIQLLTGHIVELRIPDDVAFGIITGKYEQTGGVVRWARGTEHAGQIVRHLIPFGERSEVGDSAGALLGPLRLISGSSPGSANLAALTQQIQRIATGTMTLSGLTLAVSAVSFAVLNQKLNSLEGKLDAIQADVKAIKELLHLAERARLRAAIRDLLRLDATSDPEHQHAILHGARRDLGEIHERYVELLAGANTVDAALAAEEYFSVTALARSRCTAELGMIAVARRELAEADEFWKAQARRVTKELLIGDHPERFLTREYAAVPFAVVAGWLDFAHGEDRGYGWVDELRARNPGQEGLSVSTLRGLTRLSFLRGGTPSQEQEVSALQKLVAKSAALDGYVAQYEMLAAADVRPSEFERRLAEVPAQETEGGFLILRPETEIAA